MRALGFGLITPLTIFGRIFMVVYALIGIPLALVTMSDIGRFLCDGMFKLLKEVCYFSPLKQTFQNMTAMTAVLLSMLFLYPLLGGVWIHLVSTMTLFDAIYYCCITILTVGFGDIEWAPLFLLYGPQSSDFDTRTCRFHRGWSYASDHFC